MDFARKQLEKYGWSDGKGLGKHENGISEALKPKLKRSVTGIGHDPAAEFNEHWWSALYDKAAKNVEVEDQNGKTKKIKTVDEDEFTITNSTWRINKKKKEDADNEYGEYFVKKAVLTNGISQDEDVTSDSDDEVEKKDVLKLTDEELFAACGGRTAHKGARHGLKATGKLARIAQQEQLLLTQPKYEGYSHAKKIKQKQTIEELTLEDSVTEERKNKKKKKRKRCVSNDITQSDDLLSVADIDSVNVDGDTSIINDCNSSRKSKKSKNKSCDELVVDNNHEDVKISKKRKSDIEKDVKPELVEECVPKKKKKKRAKEEC